MNRQEILEANPLPDYLRNRGFSLYPAGPNFVTNACPVEEHRKFHRCNTIDTAQNLWHCNDHDKGGTVIDWEAVEKKIEPAEAMQRLGSGPNGAKQIIATFDYTDAHGKLLYQCVRYEPKDFRQRRPDGKGGWIWNMQGVTRVLYRLGEVLKAQTVCVAEGEKDCDNLAKLGFTATTNPLGAEKWRDEYSETLRGKIVLIFGDVGDPDKKGERHTEQVIQSITGKAKALTHVRLPDGFHDITDYIKTFSSPDEAKRGIEKLIEQAQERDLSDISYKSELTTGLMSLKSHKSQSSDDHPAPLSPVAYHGLAGAFVQCVLPETEADPAALLIQFLAAFGNAIGRRAHATADGSCHGLNIFATIVGPTSKSRKRTSWTHVYRVFEHVDEEWAKNRVTGGLSSGEGLIWNVRDPIFKTVKGETQVVDEGIFDKRLFVCEEEFASILKVMAREGNTLSTVLRSAWDSGKLSTLVKNNPARATGAHISVVGHITREELRRLLTETESANGFGNRFLWLLVKRSKTLPEGGLTPAVASIVTGLHKALKFARETDQITRTEAARKLWAEGYPALSEGKPGLVGALTARSEAQVLRLSCIYALLDCSPVVDVAHLNAALEVWRYCEDSAGLIFESGTGNKDADRILQALKVAGESGLSKTQLVHDVFNRHATRFEIDEALRLLHRLDLAYCKQENTPGRPVERWFAATEVAE